MTAVAETASNPPRVAQPAISERRIGSLPGWMRLLLVVVAGVCVGLSWQPYNLWPLLFIGIPAFTLAVRGVRLRRAFGLGYVFGLALLLLAINWLQVLPFGVGFALIVFEALWYAGLGLILSLVSRLRLWPLAAAGAWSLIEFAFSRFPFGGFGWTRIAYAVVDTPISGFLPIIGVAGVSFLVALICQGIAWLVLNHAAVRSSARTLIAAAVVLIMIVGGGFALGQWQPAAAEGSVRVGIVQGNVPGRGVEAMGRARSVTNNHLRETIDLIAQSRLAGEEMPDFILWPENSTDIDPLLDYQTGQIVQAAVDLAGRPILVGAVMSGPGENERQTSSLWWDPVQGVVARYDKRNLVPFGEWIPFREQLLPLIPLLELAGAQSVPGTKPGAMEVTLTDGRQIVVGNAICFELAYDDTMYEAIRAGAQVLTVQSNNATYGGTGQIEQQFAITRARAMEAKREIAVSTTNSVSGLIDAEGRVVYKTKEFTADSTIQDMPLRTTLTPAMTVAPWVDRGAALLGLILVIVAAVARPGRFGGVRDDGHLDQPPVVHATTESESQTA